MSPVDTSDTEAVQVGRESRDERPDHNPWARLAGTFDFGRHPLMPAAGAVVALLLAILASRALSPYLVFLGITVVAAAIALVGIGVVSGRAGMISLCQLSFAA